MQDWFYPLIKCTSKRKEGLRLTAGTLSKKHTPSLYVIANVLLYLLKKIILNRGDPFITCYSHCFKILFSFTI